MTADSHDGQRSLPWPNGWSTELGGGWGKFGFVVTVGCVTMLGGGFLALDSEISGVGVMLTLFGLGSLLASPLLWPRARKGQVGRTTVTVDGRVEDGVRLPYAFTRYVWSVPGAACFAAASLALAMSAEGAALGGYRVSPVFLRAVGVVGLVFFGAGAVLLARSMRGPRWSVRLTPSALAVTHGPRSEVVSWNAIAGVSAFEVVTPRIYGASTRTPFVGIHAHDPDAISGGAFARLFRRFNRGFGADVFLPVHGLGVEPPLLYYATRFYHEHPEARRELATEDGLERIRRGKLHG